MRMQIEKWSYQKLENQADNLIVLESLEKSDVKYHRKMLATLGTALRNRLCESMSLYQKNEYQNHAVYLESELQNLGHVMVLEELFTTQCGKEYFFLTVKNPVITKENQIVGSVSVSYDITAVKQLHQKEIQKLTHEVVEKGQQLEIEKGLRESLAIYAGSMAHDLKTPIHTLGLLNEFNILAIHQISDHFFELDVLEKARFFLQKIKNNQQEIIRVLKNMTTFVDETTGIIRQIMTDQVLTNKQLNINKCLQHILSYYKEDVSQGLIQLQVVDDFNFQGNEISIYRILMNLIDNAKRQIRLKNQGNIFISSDFIEKNQQHYHILQIKDTAAGVSQTQVDQMFHLYKTGQVQGTGIGLRFCNLEMEKIGGHLSARLFSSDCIVFELFFPVIPTA